RLQRRRPLAHAGGGQRAPARLGRRAHAPFRLGPPAGAGEGVAMAMDWLDDLETRVHDAAERLRELKDQNADLERRIAELETKLAAAAEAGHAGASDAFDWAAERDDIRRRVEKLAASLDELLEE